MVSVTQTTRSLKLAAALIAVTSVPALLSLFMVRETPAPPVTEPPEPMEPRVDE